MTAEYIALNRASWDERAPAHAASPDYAFDRFVADPRYLSDVVQFDLPRLGAIDGLRGVHLQCHIGTDTVSLARLGARMSGLDFSPAALTEARRLAELARADVDFHEADVYDAAEVLPHGSFDLVFTGIGALCWLPSIERWADVVAKLLRVGGRLFLREVHPMLMTIGPVGADGVLKVVDSYFEQPEPFVDDNPGTYVETSATFTQNVTHQWNHGLGELCSALFSRGFELTQLIEHDSGPWPPFPGHMQQLPLGEFRLRDRPHRLPITFTLQAIKRR